MATNRKTLTTPDGQQLLIMGKTGTSTGAGTRPEFLLGVELKDGALKVTNFDGAANYKALRGDMVHFDNGSVFMHELGHCLPDSTKIIPKVNANPEFEDDQYFAKLTAPYEARFKRVAQVNAMLAHPAHTAEIARAECCVIFGEHATTLDLRQHGAGPLGRTAGAAGIFAHIMSPGFATKPLEAATAVAVLRGDASPISKKYNYKIDLA